MTVVLFTVALALLSADYDSEVVESTIVPDGADFQMFESVDRNEYILGAGDILQMVVQGGTSEIMLATGLASVVPCQVSGDGMLQLSGIGQVSVEDLTIAEAEGELQELVYRFYPGTRIGLVLTQPRTVKVWINGMVSEPGRYTMYAINRVSDLVAAAGGFSTYASRSGWMTTASGDSIPVDLSFSVSLGEPVSDPFLDGGAVVVLDIVRDPVFVIRPGIRNYNDLHEVPEVETWECIPRESLEDLLYRIGGITGNVDLSRSCLISGGTMEPIWSRGEGFSERTVSPGDTLRLVVEGLDVFVGGAVLQRGIISYIPGAPARSYIDRAGGVNYNGREGGTTLTRDGSVIASGQDALATEVLPGDIIDVPFSWFAVHAQEIGLLATVVGITSTIIYLTR